MKYKNSCIRQAVNIWDYIIHETKKLFASQLNKSLSGAALGITEKWRHSPNPLSSSCRHSPEMKELGLVILTCSFLSSVELAGKNVKVLERSVRKHKAFYSCAQKIIYEVTIDICSRIFTKNVAGWAVGCSFRPWEGLLSETCLWGKYLWQKKFAEFRV